METNRVSIPANLSSGIASIGEILLRPMSGDLSSEELLAQPCQPLGRPTLVARGSANEFRSSTSTLATGGAAECNAKVYAPQC